MPICQVCQKNQTNIVVNSQLSPSSNAYCQKCYQNGLEPWSDFIGTCFCLHILNEEDLKKQFSKDFIQKMLQFHTKTKGDVFQEVKKICEEFQRDMLAKGK
jgi:hypothetical protein